jgi:hypothetical protein
VPELHTTVGDLAEDVRSKNAGPFWITFDIFLDDDAAYELLVGSQAITQASIGRLYRVEPDAVEIFEIPDLRVIKISFPRSVPAGSFDDRDQHAGQQYVPLAGLPVPTATSSSTSRAAPDRDRARSG